MNKQKRLIVVGGGAAGFFCAINAAKTANDLEVIIIEKSSKILSKVKVSGGGRCNVTHRFSSVNSFASSYPRGEQWMRKLLGQFSPLQTMEWFQEKNVLLKTEEDGRIFPESNSSSTIIETFVQEANRYGVKLKLNTTIDHIDFVDNKWNLTMQRGEQMSCDFLLIASGGFPKLAQYDWLKNLNHKIITPIPSLFTFNLPKHPITNLMGVAVENAIVKIGKYKLSQSGPVLITHWGLSGPAVLKLSAWGAKELAESNYNFNASINWLPEFNENTLRDFFQKHRFDAASQKIKNKNPFSLPARLWEFLMKESEISDEIRWADLPSKNQNKFIKLLTNYEIEVSGKTIFKEEFVTAGGIDIAEIDAQTMESKLHPNLFFAGEILNVDGITGGFNFQHAWSSGWIAAKCIASRV